MSFAGLFAGGASATALILAAPAFAEPRAGQWVSLCTSGGAVMRLLPIGPGEDRAPDRTMAACHGPCTLPRKPAQRC